MEKRAKFPAMLIVRVPRSIDDQVKAASRITGISVSDLVRAALVKAWNVEQAPVEMRPQ